jgi:methionyl-tRNA synthetase
MAKAFYITTTLPYVNADPHIGFAMEIIRADVTARYHRLLGEEVVFNTGTDEHGLKIYQKALEAKKTPQAYCDEKVKNYLALKKLLNLSFTNFIRTTDDYHLQAAQEFWRRCLKNGDIYKAKYALKYCVGCELEKTDSELENNRCPIHPNREIEIINEENYFFRFSKYQKKLLDLYQQKPDFVIPKFRQEEITSFVKSGLKDFSISRVKEKMPWGVAVPDDPTQVMYVWFEALVDYISTLGWPKDMSRFNDFWPAVQIAGKDNLRQQTAMWQAMLMSAGLPPSKQIYIEGFINAEGQKMSKSLGNVVDPFAVVKKYGTDPVRYYLLREIPAYDDGDFSIHRFEELYNADLANGLGNLVARIAKLAEKSRFSFEKQNNNKIYPEAKKSLTSFRFDEALGSIWQQISQMDKLVNDQQPWNLKGEELQKILKELVAEIRKIAFNLQPFLPETAEKIINLFAGPKIKSEKPLFPRLK